MFINGLSFGLLIRCTSLWPHGGQLSALKSAFTTLQLLYMVTLLMLAITANLLAFLAKSFKSNYKADT